MARSQAATMAMPPRQLKRQWLQAIGVVGPDALQPSASLASKSSERLSKATVDATLGALKSSDGPWVASACIDILAQNSEVCSTVHATLQQDHALVKSLIDLGIEVTDKAAKSAQAGSEQPREQRLLLGARNMLCIFLERWQVWQRLYGTDRQKQGSGDAHNLPQDEEFEAWADVADTTPSPAPAQSDDPSMSAIDFIAMEPSTFAKQLAMSNQPRLLASLLQSTTPAMMARIFVQRFTIVRMLLIACATKQGDFNMMLQSRLLPGFNQERETGIWAERFEAIKASAEAKDIANEEHAIALQDQGTDKVASMSHPARRPASEEYIAQFYVETISDVESLFGEHVPAARLADIASKLGLTSEKLQTLASDLGLVEQLQSKSSPSYQDAPWTLDRFRESYKDAVDVKSVARLALIFVRDADSPDSAGRAWQDGSLRFVRSAQQQIARHAVALNENDVFTNMLLQLAQNGHLTAALHLIESGKQYELPMTEEQEKRALLSFVLGLDLQNMARMHALNRLLQARQSSKIRQPASSLREIVGALLSFTNAKATCEGVYMLLEHSAPEDLDSYIDHCHAMLDAMIRMQRLGIPFVSLPWLLDLEGSSDRQVTGVTAIVRSMSQSQRAPRAHQYSDLSATLMECVGPGKIFDKLNQKDIVRFIAEGAARCGEASTFLEVIENEDDGTLTSEAREKLVLDAVVELHASARSANLHQGETKTAYDLLRVMMTSSPSHRLELEKGFLEASSKLASYRVHSITDPGTLISPKEIRSSSDRMELVQRMLFTQDDMYKASDIVLDLAYKLCAIPPGPGSTIKSSQEASPPHRTDVQCRTLGMLAEAAMAAGDYQHAEEFSDQLVALVMTLSKRVEQMDRQADVQTSANTQTRHLRKLASEITHRTCHQLAKQPEWDNHASRLRWAAHALAFCPPEHLGKYLGVWRDLAKHLEAAFQSGPAGGLFDDLNAADTSPSSQSRAAASAAAVGVHLSSGLNAAIQQARFASGGASASGLGAAGLAALSQFGGSLETYATPLGSLFSRAPSAVLPLSTASNRQAQEFQDGSNEASAAGGVDPRTAQLFDNLSGDVRGSMSPRAATSRTHDTDSRQPIDPTAQQPYLDPAERAARAARRFFRGL